MKQQFAKLSFFAILAALFTLGSCAEEEILPPAPVVTIAEGSSATILPGEKLTLNVSVSSVEKLESVVIYKGDFGISQTKITQDINEFSFPVFEYTPTTAEENTTIVFTFVAHNIRLNTGKAEFTLTVGELPKEKALAYEKIDAAILANRIGPNQSAFDLVANVRKGKDDTNADMQNPSIATGTTAEQWIKGWDSETTTKYVKLADTFDYANATVEKITTAYTDGVATATDKVRNLAVGQIYVAKLRGKEAYALIKITRVDNAVAAGSSRTEEIHFNYKKESANTGS